MEQKQQFWSRVGKVLSKRIGIIGIVVLVLACIITGLSIAGYIFRLEWTGVLGTQDNGPKTLWHWLDLLIIPIMLAAGALWFKQAAAKATAYIEDQRAQESALEAYLDRMSELLLDKDDPLLKSRPGSPCQEMASTRTLTLLRRLDGRRRNQVFQFLRDARLLGVKKKTARLEEGGQIRFIDEIAPISVFEGRNMQKMELQDAILELANLSGAFLEGANLERAKLCGARFANAKMKGAFLKGAILRGANLAADLHGANLSNADMRWANLYAADLSEANLFQADLRGAKNLSCERLTQALNWDQAYRDEALSCGKEIPTLPKYDM